MQDMETDYKKIGRFVKNAQFYFKKYVEDSTPYYCSKISTAFSRTNSSNNYEKFSFHLEARFSASQLDLSRGFYEWKWYKNRLGNIRELEK